MKTHSINTKRLSVLLLTILVAFSFLDSVESSKLKRTRRSIENSDDSQSDKGKWSSFYGNRLTKPDDSAAVRGALANFAGASKNSIGKLFGRIGSLIGLLLLRLQTLLNAPLDWTIGALQRLKIIGKEPEPEPPQSSTISSIYDSISSAIYGSQDAEPIKENSKTKTSSTTSKAKPKATTKSASLHQKKSLLKATSKGPLGKKSNFEDLKGAASAFESRNAAVAVKNEDEVAIPSTSQLASFLPSLVAGFVFATTGAIVGMLWNTEWRALVWSSGWRDYVFGGEKKMDSSDETTANSSLSDDHGSLSSSSAVPITPEKI